MLPHLWWSPRTSASDQGRLTGSPLQLRETTLKLNCFVFFFFLYCCKCPYRWKKGESSRTKVRGEESPRHEILKSNLLNLKWLTSGKFTKELHGLSSDTIVTGAPPILWAQCNSLLRVYLCLDCSKQDSQKPAQAILHSFFFFSP